ncbi:MAG: DUF1540 domain-containing protein [Firmicutes bacterium]|nr:DUF1540 domain-containing protein [Bacillota bacterium]
MAKNQIHCAVEECVHNKSMRCAATSIRVRSRSGSNGAHSSEDTNCETFKPRKSL